MDWNFKTKPTLFNTAATGLALVMLTLGPVAYAQEAETVETTTAEDESEDELGLDAIRITGIRQSIETSLQAKKDNTSIVEAISAEDIGKLPDVSIADSLARLPGVTAQRVRGRAQQISIRGLGPDFSLALLNGREVVSSGNNRGIEFDQFPSELIAQGLVYKTPDARLAATGIAGAVDLRTIKPLDFGDRQFNVSAKYVLNDQDQLNPDFDEDGYRLFGSYIDQNEDGTLGWYLGVTVQSNPTQFTSRELKVNGGQSAVLNGVVIPRDNPRTGVVSREFSRTTVAGALQFEPNDSVSSSLDVFFSDSEDAGIFRGVETPLASWAGVGDDAVTTTGSGGFADTATYAGVGPILRTDTEGNESEIFAIGTNTVFRVTDTLAFTLDMSHSTLDRDDIDYESYGGTGSGILGSGSEALDTLTFNFDPDGEYSIDPGKDYTDPNVVFLADPGGWGQVGFIKRPIIEDELSALRLEAEKDLDLPFISGIVAGVRYSDREKQFDSNESFLRNSAAWTPGANGNLIYMISASDIVGATNDGGTGFPIIAYNPASFLTNGVYTVEKATFDTQWRVAEEIVTLYGMLNIDDEIGGIPVRGNLGVQYVDTQQASTGTLNFFNRQQIQTVEESYSNWLPSLNLSFEIMPDTFVRTSAAQTLTRPRLDQMAANQGLGFDNRACLDSDGDQIPDTATGGFNPPEVTCFTLGGGNPFLEPYESTSFDLSFEKYFDDTTALAVAVFHKELDNWIIDRSVIIDGSQSIAVAGLSDFADNSGFNPTKLSGPINAVSGSISGVELTARVNLDNVLPENLAGFGVNASYTYADNELSFPGGGDISIPGYSDTVWSGDVYYENYGFRARLSGRYRSEFLSEVQAFDGSLGGAQALEEFIVDAQIGYEWSEGPLEGLSLNFEAYNLTNEPFTTEDVTANPDVTFPSRYELYGTTYNITVAKKF